MINSKSKEEEERKNFIFTNSKQNGLYQKLKSFMKKRKTQNGKLEQA